MLQDQEKKEFWLCMIGGVPSKDVPMFGDYPMRQAVRDKWFEMFGVGDEVCSSGWGIDEERFELLRILHVLPTAELKTFVDMHNEAQITTHE